MKVKKSTGMNRMLDLILKFKATSLAMLREVFDEAPYARFLSQAGIKSSPQAYAAFRQESEAAKQRRPKCC